MKSTNEHSSRADLIRKEAVAVFDDLISSSEKFEFAAPPDALLECRKTLSNPQFNVLVVGEAKRGKSTFVNALLGREVLPTDVEIATAQVFRVSKSTKEGYRLRFEDNSVQEISVDDLPRYGSQSYQDHEGAVELDQVVRWIEIEMPVRFLPDGLNLLDTPGLGSLYAPHALITQRFVAEADAVIFVLDSEQPIISREIEFLERILAVTSHVFFVQTKIDAFGKEQWEQVLARNRQIIEDKVGDRLPDAQVWPIGSKILLEAADETDDEEFEALALLSRYRELALALNSFLWTVAGWRQMTGAVLLAAQCHNQGENLLSARLSALQDETNQTAQKIRGEFQSRRATFDGDWGSHGQQRGQLATNLKRVLQIGRSAFRRSLEPDGKIACELQTKIDVVENLEQARALGKDLPGMLGQRALLEWKTVCDSVERQCLDVLEPFYESLDTLSIQESGDELTLGSSGEVKTKPSPWDLVKGASREGFSVQMLTTLTAGIVLGLTGLSIMPVVLPIMAIGALAGTLFGLVQTHKKYAEDAKRELRKNLVDALKEVRRHFFDVELGSIRDNRVDEFFFQYEQNTLSKVDELSRRKTEELKEELRRLAEESKAGEQERREMAMVLKDRLQQWDEVGRRLEGLGNQIAEVGDLAGATKHEAAPTTAAGGAEGASQ